MLFRSLCCAGSPVCQGTPCLISSSSPHYDYDPVVKINQDTSIDAIGYPHSTQPQSITLKCGRSKRDMSLCEETASFTGNSMQSRSITIPPRGGARGLERVEHGPLYTYVDEPFLKSLHEETSWAREYGIIELIPIAVVASKDF